MGIGSSVEAVKRYCLDVHLAAQIWKIFPEGSKQLIYCLYKFFSLVLRIIVKLDDVNEAAGFGLWSRET